MDCAPGEWQRRIKAAAYSGYRSLMAQSLIDASDKNPAAPRQRPPLAAIRRLRYRFTIVLPLLLLLLTACSLPASPLELADANGGLHRPLDLRDQKAAVF